MENGSASAMIKEKYSNTSRMNISQQVNMNCSYRLPTFRATELKKLINSPGNF
jgi:hypothetical protein